MATSQPAALRPVTLEQLIALNEEIAALVRVGVPLGQGLQRLGRDMPGRLGEVAQTLAERVNRGENLCAILEANPQTFPSAYRAVVAAGLRTGRLARALELLTETAEHLAEAHRIVVAAFVYPLMVFLLAWGLFVFFVLKIAPVVAIALSEFEAPGRAFFAHLASWGSTAAWWGPAIPGAVLVSAGAWAFFCRRAMSLEPRAAGLLLGWLPWTRRMLHYFRIAVFSEMLGLLVENDVPLDAAVVLAAESVGSARSMRASRTMAGSLQRGDSLTDFSDDAGLPPLVSWLLATGQAQGGLLSALRQSTGFYYRRAKYQAEAARLLVPIVVSIVVAGGVTFAYALTVFGSWILLLRSLAGV